MNNPDKIKTMTQHVIIFDTLQYVKCLKVAGLTLAKKSYYGIFHAMKIAVTHNSI